MESETINFVEMMGETMLKQKFSFINQFKDALQHPRFVNFIKEMTAKDFEKVWDSQRKLGFYAHEGKLITDNYSDYSINKLFRISVSFKIEIVAGNIVQVYYRSDDFPSWLKYSYTDDILLISILWRQVMQIIEILKEKEAENGI